MPKNIRLNSLLLQKRTNVVRYKSAFYYKFISAWQLHPYEMETNYVFTFLANHKVDISFHAQQSMQKPSNKAQAEMGHSVAFCADLLIKRIWEEAQI